MEGGRALGPWHQTLTKKNKDWNEQANVLSYFIIERSVYNLFLGEEAETKIMKIFYNFYIFFFKFSVKPWTTQPLF